jgi:hypothetical protein
MNNPETQAILNKHHTETKTSNTDPTKTIGVTSDAREG